MRRFLAAALVLAGCSGEPVPEGQALTLRFRAAVGAEDFAVKRAYSGVGKPGTVFTASDLRLYVHDFKLLRAGGDEVAFELDQDGKWQYQSVALLDFEDTATAETNAQVTGHAPAGSYTGVHFKVGVPFELNHKDIGSAPSPLNLSTMYWAWNGGYKFTHIEGKSTAQLFIQVHLGSTGCMGGVNVTSCSRPNRADVVLTGFDPSAGTMVLDLARLFADNDLDLSSSCLGEVGVPACAGIFKNLGLDLQSGTPSTSQTLFRLP